MIELVAFFATFLRVFARAFQQKNVIGNHYFAIAPVSFIMAALEVLIVMLIVTGDGSIPLLIMAMGAGGWLGAISAMRLHSKVFDKNYDRDARYAREYIDGMMLDRTVDPNVWRSIECMWNQINRSKR